MLFFMVFKMHSPAIIVTKVASGKIELHLWHTLQEVLGDSTGVTGVRLQSTQGGASKDLVLKGCFIAIS